MKTIVAIALFAFACAANALSGTLQIIEAPTTVAPGAQFTATFRLTNTGATIPYAGAQPAGVGSQGPENNFVWGVARVALLADLQPGQSVDVVGVFVAPTGLGPHSFTWACVQEFVSWFCNQAGATITVGSGGGGTGDPPPPASEPTFVNLPAARSDGSLVSAAIINTGPYVGDGIQREAVWTNNSGRTLSLRKIYVWSGVDLGARADVHADVSRVSDSSFIAIMQWDRYAEPTAPDNNALFKYAEGEMLIPQGDGIKLRYLMHNLSGSASAHHAVIIWAK